MRWETVYTPNGSGTVLSPDNYLNNNDENFYSFNHRGTRQNTGEITFTDNNDKVLESIKMVRNYNGQWLTKNKVIMPEAVPKYAIKQVTTRAALRRQQRRQAEMNQQQTEDSSETTNDITSRNNGLSPTITTTLDVEEDNNTGVTEFNNNTNDIITRDETSSTVEIEPPTRMKPSQQLELWHQRMGHISPGTLQATQQCTTGIPKFKKATSLF